MKCFFASDLHGKIDRYEKLFGLILTETPDTVFIGGDILPSYTHKITSNKIFDEFIEDYLIKNLIKIKAELKDSYPEILVIFGNDDLKAEEYKLTDAEKTGLLKYVNFKKINSGNRTVFGYSYVPPSPFLLKDWEKYDVSRYVDPGCVSPEEGYRSVEVDEFEIRFSTIKNDLNLLVGNTDVSDSIFLFHSPPYKTNLDRLANDGKFIDYVPLDNNAGSIAIRKFIEEKQPFLTLHGHIHESTRLTGNWKDKIGNTYCFNAANDGDELSLIIFDTEKIGLAKRILV